jgi:hypothetical protein
VLRRRSIDDWEKAPVGTTRVDELERVQVAPVDAHEPFGVSKLLDHHPAVRPGAHRIAASHMYSEGFGPVHFDTRGIVREAAYVGHGTAPMRD